MIKIIIIYLIYRYIYDCTLIFFKNIVDIHKIKNLKMGWIKISNRKNIFKNV